MNDKILGVVICFGGILVIILIAIAIMIGISTREYNQKFCNGIGFEDFDYTKKRCVGINEEGILIHSKKFDTGYWDDKIMEAGE